MDGVDIMKGFTHFISGVAFATFSSQAVNMAAKEHSIILVLGGIFGILPDTLDFKVAKFFYEEDYIITPKPDDFNVQEIAETLAKAIDEAKEGEPTKVRLNTVKFGADLWQQYIINFRENEVIVKKGPVVNTSKVPMGTYDESKCDIAIVKTKSKILHSYDKDTYVDIFSGPSFEFKRMKDGSVEAEFLPWHRRWSHSLTLGIFFGIIGYIIAGLLSGDWMLARIYGLVIGGGFCVHVIEDQFGFMGSNLFWPFTKERVIGLKWMRSSDAWPNFITVWIAVLCIIWNLNRFSDTPAFHSSLVEFLGYTFFLPLSFILMVGFFTNRVLKPIDVNEANERFKEVMVENEEEET